MTKDMSLQFGSLRSRKYLTACVILLYSFSLINNNESKKEGSAFKAAACY